MPSLAILKKKKKNRGTLRVVSVGTRVRPISIRLPTYIYIIYDLFLTPQKESVRSVLLGTFHKKKRSGKRDVFCYH